MNNNQIRKFKVGSLYRNNVCPKTLYLCIGDAEWLDDKIIRYTKKHLVVFADETGGAMGHIISSEAVENWKWRKV